MRHKSHLYRRELEIAQLGRARSTGGLWKLLLVVALLGGGWFVFDHLLSLPSEAPTVMRYEVLPIQP